MNNGMRPQDYMLYMQSMQSKIIVNVKKDNMKCMKAEI